MPRSLFVWKPYAHPLPFPLSPQNTFFGTNHTSRANFDANATQQSRQIEELKLQLLEIIVANSGMKHKSETMLEVIRVLVLAFVLFFVTV